MRRGDSRRRGFAGLACRLCLVALASAWLGGCSVLPEPATPASQYRLSADVGGYRSAADGPVLVVAHSSALGGYETTAMRYREDGARLARYATGVWVEPPAAMLNEAAVAALGASGRFRAVVATTDAVSGDLRVSLELQRLVHDLSGAGGGRVRLQLRMTLTDRDGRVLAADVLEAASGEVAPGPESMAAAAESPLRTVMQQLVERVTRAIEGIEAE